MARKRKKTKSRRKPRRREEREEKNHMEESTGSRSGGLSFGSVGSKLGEFAGNAIGSLFGMGEYESSLAGELGVDEVAHNATPEVNSLVTPLSSNEIVPFMHSDAEGMITFTRREFVQNVNISTAGATSILQVHPTSTSFPWLSNIAGSWQQWSVTGLAYEYVPTSGFAVGVDGSASLGSIAMAFKYNVDEQTSGSPTHSLTALLNQNGATSHSPAAAGVCYMECDPSQGGANSVNPIRFVQTAETKATNWSTADFMCADFIIKAQGSQNADPTQAGQLWCTYEITLYQPRVDTIASSFLDMPAYAPFKELYQRYKRLTDETGPYTDREVIEREAELRRISNMFRTDEYRNALNTSIYESEIQELEDREHPIIPEPLGPLEGSVDTKILGGAFTKVPTPGT